MLVRKGFRNYLFTVFVVRFFSATYGLTIYNKEKTLTNEEKRGAIDIKNEIDTSDKAKTEKRGIWEIGSNNDHYGGGPPRPNGPPNYGGYESSGYGGGYSHTGIGSAGHSGPGYYGEGHHPGESYGYPEENRRPSGYGVSYGPNYGHGNEGGYEDEHQYHDHGGGGGGGYDIGNLKTLALKKLLLPLAGLAILGVAAVASQNPVLLQLGVVNGRRKRSALHPDVYPSNPKVKPWRKY